MLVTVIIPCYNVAEYITECLESVFNQTHKDLEVICVDNNSTDSTLKVLQNLQTKHPFILEQESIPGAPNARNKGLSRAKGEWIQFLDADDLLLSEKIITQLQLIENKNNIGFVAGSYFKEKINKVRNTFISIGAVPHGPLINKAGITSSNLWNAEAIKIAGNWDINLKSSQEADLMFRIIEQGFRYLNDVEINTIVRERESGQISQRNPIEKWKQYIQLRLDYIQFLKEKSPDDYEKIEGLLNDFILNSILTLSNHSKKEAYRMYSLAFLKERKTVSSYGISPIKSNLLKVLGFKAFCLLHGIFKRPSFYRQPN